MPPPAPLQLLRGPPSGKQLQERSAATQRRPRDTARSKPGRQPHERPPSDNAQMGETLSDGRALCRKYNCG
eukprot:15966915-Heterocapsa_arctica.AAC.1